MTSLIRTSKPWHAHQKAGLPKFKPFAAGQGHTFTKGIKWGNLWSFGIAIKARHQCCTHRNLHAHGRCLKQKINTTTVMSITCLLKTDLEHHESSGASRPRHHLRAYRSRDCVVVEGSVRKEDERYHEKTPSLQARGQPRPKQSAILGLFV